MTRTELTNILNKMYCNHVQEGGDIETFFEVAMDYIEENSDIDFEEALQIFDDVVNGR